MERKAPCAECEGKVSTVYFSTQVIWVDVCLFRCFFLFFFSSLVKVSQARSADSGLV